jgi:hypothetical protein
MGKSRRKAEGKREKVNREKDKRTEVRRKEKIWREARGNAGRAQNWKQKSRGPRNREVRVEKK